MRFEVIYLLLSIILTIMLMSCTATEYNNNNNSSLELKNNNNKKLSRKKRYIVFPEGSSFSVAVCMTIGVYGNPNYQLFSWALNWGIAYNLPNETLSFHNKNNNPDPEMPKPVMQRRYRRELYNKLELAINDMGYDGRECILRAICESPQYFKKKGGNMVEELLRTIFSLPKSKVLSFEHKDLMDYDGAHRRGLTNSYCPTAYPKCRFSLLDLAMGYYSKPENLNFIPRIKIKYLTGYFVNYTSNDILIRQSSNDEVDA